MDVLSSRFCLTCLEVLCCTNIMPNLEIDYIWNHILDRIVLLETSFGTIQIFETNCFS